MLPHNMAEEMNGDVFSTGSDVIYSTPCGLEFAEAFSQDLINDAKQNMEQEEVANRRHEVIQQLKQSSVNPTQGSDANYRKWDAINQSIELEEEEERKKTEAETEENRKRMAAMGCSHDHTKERLVFEKSTSENIRAADRFRLEGNAAYKNQNYGLAAVNYRKALLQFDYCFPDTEEETKWFDDVKLPCHLNLAAVKIHQEDWDEVLTQCRLALEIDSKNCKALYRRGIVYLKLDFFDKAQEALEEALGIEPGSKATKAALDTLLQKRVRYKKRNREVYAAMIPCGKDQLTTTAAEQVPDSNACSVNRAEDGGEGARSANANGKDEKKEHWQDGGDNGEDWIDIQTADISSVAEPNSLREEAEDVSSRGAVGHMRNTKRDAKLRRLPKRQREGKASDEKTVPLNKGDHPRKNKTKSLHTENAAEGKDTTYTPYGTKLDCGGEYVPKRIEDIPLSSPKTSTIVGTIIILFMFLVLSFCIIMNQKQNVLRQLQEKLTVVTEHESSILNGVFQTENRNAASVSHTDGRALVMPPMGDDSDNFIVPLTICSAVLSTLFAAIAWLVFSPSTVTNLLNEERGRHDGLLVHGRGSPTNEQRCK